MNPKRKPQRKRSLPLAERPILRPQDLELRYNISAPTRWRWERDGRLPPRDVFIGGKPEGWRRETLEAADRGPRA
jgi:predicted DNA-binding transcriptional regulator AlpA